MDQSVSKGASRKSYLDILRVIAILAVVLMHSTGFFDNTVQIHSVQWNCSIIFGSITRFAVPVFIMISGALMLNKESIDIKRLYSKNILRFVTAYLFWSIFYTIVYSFIPHYGSISIISIKNLISGTLKGGYFHLWYMPLIIGLYVALPLLHACLRSMRRELIGYWVLMSFLICFVLPQMREIEIVNYIFGEAIDHFNVGLWGEYLLYFILGYALDKYELPDRAYKAICVGGMICALFTIAAVWIPSAQAGNLVGILRMNNTPNVLWMSVALFLFVKKHSSRLKVNGYNRILSFLSELSFGVYFVHEFVLVELHDLFFRSSNAASAILVLFVTGTIVSYALIWMIRKVTRLSRYIT